VFEIPESSRQAKGQAIVNLIQVEPGEKVTAVLTQTQEGKIVEAGDDASQKPAPKYLFMATLRGTVKKTALSEYKNIRKSGLTAIRLLGEDELAWVRPTSGEDNIMLVTRGGKSICFSENDVSTTGRATVGVRGIKISAGDECIGMDIVPAKATGKEAALLVVSEHGYGKKTAVSQYPIQGRGGMGVLTFRISDKTGNLTVVRLIEAAETADILLTSVQGVVIREPLADIPTLGRQTSGVKMIRLAAGDRVAALAYLPEDQADQVPVQDAIE
jgi:DNA gyrase subunit A